MAQHAPQHEMALKRKMYIKNRLIAGIKQLKITDIMNMD